MTEKSVFDYRDEIARFEEFKFGKANLYVAGSMPSKRVKMKE